MRLRSIQIRLNTIAAGTMNAINTTPCDTQAAAINTDAHTRNRPVSRPWASTPSASIAIDSEIENENSPAMVDFRLPP